MINKRKSGVLMHVSSLWGEYSEGSFGKEAFEFVSELVKNKRSYPITEFTNSLISQHTPILYYFSTNL